MNSCTLSVLSSFSSAPLTLQPHCGWQWGEHHGICWKCGSFYHSSQQRSHCLKTSVLRVHFMKVTLPTFQFYSCVCLKIPFISCLKIHERQGTRNIFISHVQTFQERSLFFSFLVSESSHCSLSQLLYFVSLQYFSPSN